MSADHSLPSVNRTHVAVQLAALSALGPFCIDAYLPSMQDIAARMQVPLEAVQGTLTAYMIPFALMTLWHGSLSDRFGRKRMVLWGLTLFFFASVGCALAPNLAWLLAFRCLQGATAGVGMVVGRAIVRDLYEGPEAQRLMALVAIVFAIAPAVAPLVGGWLHHWFGWRSVFAFMALYTATVFAMIRWRLPETLPQQRRQPFHPGFLARSYLAAFRSPVFLSSCLAITTAFAGLFLYVLSAPVFLMKHLHVSETGFLWLFGPLTLGIVLGNGLSSRLAGKLSLLRTATWGCAVMLLSSFANVGLNLLSEPALPWAIMPLFFYMVGMSLTMPTLTLRAMDCFPRQRGLAASCQSFVQSTGSSLISVGAPLVWSTSLRLSLTQLGAATVSAGLLGLLVWLTRGPHSATVSATASDSARGGAPA